MEAAVNYVSRNSFQFIGKTVLVRACFVQCTCAIRTHARTHARMAVERDK